jgi:hypothetical protein
VTLRVGMDVDGVLADFRSAFREAAGALADVRDATEAASPRLSSAELKRAWKDVSTHPNWWVSLQPYEPQEIARLYTLARRGRWEVFFLTKRPATTGDSVQFQTQWWLEQHGFYLPSVMTVPGSRGDLANALHLDIVVDDLPLNCVEVISGSNAKALLVARDRGGTDRDSAMNRGIGVVATLREAIDVLERLQDVISSRRGRLLRLIDWLPGGRKDEPELPLDPRTGRPVRDV